MFKSILCLTFASVISSPLVSLNPNLFYSGTNGLYYNTVNVPQNINPPLTYNPYYTQRAISNAYGPNAYTGFRQISPAYVDPAYSVPNFHRTVIQYPTRSQFIPNSWSTYPITRYPVTQYPISHIPEYPLNPNPFIQLSPNPVIQTGLGGHKIDRPGIPTHPGYRPPAQWNRLWPPIDNNFNYDPNTGVVSYGDRPNGSNGLVPTTTQTPETSTETDGTTEEKTEETTEATEDKTETNEDKTETTDESEDEDNETKDEENKDEE